MSNTIKITNIGSINLSSVMDVMREYHVPKRDFVVEAIPVGEQSNAIQVGIYLESWGLTHKMCLCYDADRKRYYMSPARTNHPNVVKFDAAESNMAGIITDVVRQIVDSWVWMRRRFLLFATFMIGGVGMWPIWAMVLGHAS